MKTLDIPLQIALESGSIRSGHLLKLTRRDGTIFAVTTFDRDIVADGITYLANPGMFAGAIVTTDGLTVGNMEIKTLHDETIFTNEALLGGLWRSADFTISLFNWDSYDDPHWANTRYLLRFNDAERATTFVDEVGARNFAIGTGGDSFTSKVEKTWQNGAQGSLRLRGKVPMVRRAAEAQCQAFAADFTVEFEYWADRNNNGATQLIWQGGSATVGNRNMVWLNSSGQLVVTGNGTNHFTITAPTARTWHHVAVARQGVRSMLFIDGVLTASGTSLAWNNASSDTNFGQNGFFGGIVDPFVGYIRNFRLTAACRYEYSFPPIRSPYPSNSLAQVNTLLTGVFGEHRIEDGVLTIELRDLRQVLQQGFGSVSSKNCRARLGDARCKKDLAPYIVGANNDYYFDKVKSLLHFDGSDGSSTITDVIAGHSWTATGALITTSQSKFGGASLNFDATSDRVTHADHADFELGASNFTMEMWLRPNAATVGTIGVGTVCTKRANTASFGPFWLGFYFNLSFYASSNGSSWNVIGQGQGSFGALTPDVWTHIAITREGRRFRGFVNGILVWTVLATSDVVLFNNANNFSFGESSGVFIGQIDDFRLTIGQCRYRTNFTVPAVAYVEVHTTGISTVTSVSNPRSVFTDNTRSETADFFGEGLVDWITGNNAGLQSKVKSYTAGQFSLSIPLFSDIQVGDTYRPTPGCRQRLEEDCDAKWDNVVNFVGEPHRPKIDDLTETPETA